MSKLYGWHVLLILVEEILILTVCEINQLICNERNDVSFQCPCSEEFNECRFKKLFQGGYIVRDDSLNNHHHKYKFNERKTHITLKECNDEDEGTYVWMCGRCNVNRQFDLKVHKISEEILSCSIGGAVSFECPCCAEELDSCKFMKNGQDGYIVPNGISSHHYRRYEFNEKKTHITLKECNEDDEGTYVWMCGRCNVNKQFHLKVLEVTKDLKCPVGEHVFFECPCPQELDTCRFVKLEQKRQIVRNGVLINDHKYEFNEDKTHITLKECHEDDEGTYVWMCGGCNVNKQFHLEVQNSETSQGSSGDKISVLILIYASFSTFLSQL